MVTFACCKEIHPQHMFKLIFCWVLHHQ